MLKQGLKNSRLVLTSKFSCLHLPSFGIPGKNTICSTTCPIDGSREWTPSEQLLASNEGDELLNFLPLGQASTQKGIQVSYCESRLISSFLSGVTSPLCKMRTWDHEHCEDWTHRLLCEAWVQPQCCELSWVLLLWNLGENAGGGRQMFPAHVSAL